MIYLEIVTQENDVAVEHHIDVIKGYENSVAAVITEVNK